MYLFTQKDTFFGGLNWLIEAQINVAFLASFDVFHAPVVLENELCTQFQMSLYLTVVSKFTGLGCGKFSMYTDPEGSQVSCNVSSLLG